MEFTWPCLSPFISDPVWDVFAIVRLNTRKQELLSYYDFWWWQIGLEVTLFPWKVALCDFFFHTTSILLFFSFVVVWGRAVTRNSNPWIVKKEKICLLIFKSFLSKSWIHMELFGDFFAATALPPNGMDQRLLHCSLPLCLCSESAHCSAAHSDGLTITGVPPTTASPIVPLLWHWPWEFRKVQRQQGQRTTQLWCSL